MSQTPHSENGLEKNSSEQDAMLALVKIIWNHPKMNHSDKDDCYDEDDNGNIPCKKVFNAWNYERASRKALNYAIIGDGSIKFFLKKNLFV
jgi:hypothetical protein